MKICWLNAANFHFKPQLMRYLLGHLPLKYGFSISLVGFSNMFVDNDKFIKIQDEENS